MPLLSCVTLSAPSFSFFFFNDTATTEIYTLSLHDALPISWASRGKRSRFASRCDSAHRDRDPEEEQDRKSTRLNSSHVAISYAVFCLKKKKKNNKTTSTTNKWRHTYNLPPLRIWCKRSSSY